MQQRVLGKTGLQVSVLTLGGGGIGMVWGPTTDEECVETVKAAVANGVNLLDLAPVYGKGKSEEIVGQAWRDLPIKRELEIGERLLGGDVLAELGMWRRAQRAVGDRIGVGLGRHIPTGERLAVEEQLPAGLLFRRS